MQGFNGSRFEVRTLGWTSFLSAPRFGLNGLLTRGPYPNTAWTSKLLLTSQGGSLTAEPRPILTGANSTTLLVKVNGVVVKPGAPPTTSHQGIRTQLLRAGGTLLISVPNEYTGTMSIRLVLATFVSHDTSTKVKAGKAVKVVKQVVTPYLNLFVTLPSKPKTQLG